MIKKLALALVLALSCSSAFAGSGIFGSGVELNANGAANNTLYGLNNSGGTRLKPVGSSATLDQTSWNNGSDASPQLNLGTFDITLGQTLTLDGGSLLTFKNSGSNVTGAFLDYRIFPAGSPSGGFTEVSLPFNEDNVNAASGDQRWATEGLTVNLLAGLPNGNYELSVFLRETSSDGGAFSSQSGANYAADFSVVPEPSTIAAGVLAVFGTLAMARRRAKSAV
jgi:hypothetical protein